MKICPNCQKEFPDAMRFCQTDGTLLVEVAEQPAEDLLKTTVIRAEDIMAALPPSDPYKTVVGGAPGIEDSGDLLQLPEEIDPMKTMIATPIITPKAEQPAPVSELPSPVSDPALPVLDPEASKPGVFEDIRKEIQPESPYNAFDAFQQPAAVQLPNTPIKSDDPTVLQPEPPSFRGPEPAPPSFGSLSGSPEPVDDTAATMIQGGWDSAPKIDDSPFSKPPQTPDSSPFAIPSAPQSPFDTPSPPQSPFDSPAAPSFDSPFSQPSSFQEPPPPQFGQSFEPMNQSFGDQPLQPGEWTPPAPPEQGWQNQGLGAGTPFQPPVVGEGQNKTLAIVSVICGVLSVVCCFSFITGPVGLITGIMARKKVAAEPAIYGGAGLALAGIITGAIGTIIGTLVTVLQVLSVLANGIR